MKAAILTLCSLLIGLSLFAQDPQRWIFIDKGVNGIDSMLLKKVNRIYFKEVQPVYTGTVTDIDGNVYTTVQIGNQEWTVENLRTTKYNDGTDIPKVVDNIAWTELATGAYCALNNDENNVATYGYLYNWHSLSTGKLAPAGWRVPTVADWTTLIDFLGGSTIAGEKLKTVSGWNDNGNGTDDYGFSALPGGRRVENEDASFGFFGSLGFWWSFSAFDSTTAWGWDLFYWSNEARRNVYDLRCGLSVRLIRDL